MKVIQCPSGQQTLLLSCATSIYFDYAYLPSESATVYELIKEGLCVGCVCKDMFDRAEVVKA